MDFVFQHVDGRSERVRKRSPVQTRRGAEEYERQLRQERLDPRPRRKEVPTFETFEEEFRETYVATNNSPSEQEAKRYTIARHLLPRFKGKRLNQIGVREVERLKADLKGEGYAPATINNVLTVLSKMLRYAIEVELLDKVPRFKLLKVPPQAFAFHDFDDYEQLVSALEEKDGELAVAVLLGGDAGLRRGEIAALQWGDINFPANKLTVLRSIWRGQEVAPKGGRSRVVPMTQRLHRALKAHRHLRAPHVLVRGDSGRWIKAANEPWSPEVFRWQGDRAHRLAGLPRPQRPWHCLRHTFCSHLAMRGATPKAIQELAGHQQIETTMKYMHLAPVALTSAIELLDTREAGAEGAAQWHHIGTPADGRKKGS